MIQKDHLREIVDKGIIGVKKYSNCEIIVLDRANYLDLADSQADLGDCIVAIVHRVLGLHVIHGALNFAVALPGHRAIRLILIKTALKRLAVREFERADG